MSRGTKENEDERERRRAYYEQLTPAQKRAYRERRIREKKLKKLKKMMLQAAVLFGLILVSVIGITVQRHGGKKTDGGQDNWTGQDSSAQNAVQRVQTPDWIIQDFIRVNPYSRPGTTMEQVNGVVVHYTANPGTTAEQNRRYFDGLADSKETSASSHFVIGIDGTVIQCIPLDEIAYASNDRNADTISIECCHPDETGQFSDQTYQSLVRLVRWLEEAYDLKPENVIRHYDVTGKMCPLYFVEHPDAWEQFLKDIAREDS